MRLFLDNLEYFILFAGEIFSAFISFFKVDSNFNVFFSVSEKFAIEILFYYFRR